MVKLIEVEETLPHGYQTENKVTPLLSPRIGPPSSRITVISAENLNNFPGEN